MSIGFVITPDANLGRVEGILSKIAKADIPDLLDEIGGLIVDQINVRFDETKKRPDGTDWSSPPWSRKWEQWRIGHGKMAGGYLSLEGLLNRSIQHLVAGRTLAVGSDLKYARRQQMGGGGIPAREYLGLSSGDADEIEAEVAEWLEELMG